MNYTELPEMPTPECYRRIEYEDGRIFDVEYNSIDIFSGGRSGGDMLYTGEQMQQYALLAVGDLQRQLAAITEDYKELEAQLMAVGAGGVSKLMGDKE